MTYRNPTPTVDIIIELVDRPHRPIVLIERHNPPLGWAIPGGFIDYGESAEAAARREAEEETGLHVELVEQFQVYSDPSRDPSAHNECCFFGNGCRKPGTPRDWGCLNRGEYQLTSALTTIASCGIMYRHYGLRPRLS